MSIRNISVIIPCYKAAATLRRAAASALADAPAGLELLLVDDGSPDDTGTLCDTLAAEDPRVRALAPPKRRRGCGAQHRAGCRARRLGAFFSMPMMSCCRDFGPRLRHFPPRRT